MSNTTTISAAPARKAPATDRANTFHNHMRANENECIRHNIVVRVDSINATGKVVFCTVEQRLFGMCRRKRSTSELLYRAEQALAPLSGLGLLPMITVLHPDRAKAAQRRAKGWFAISWRWLGYPFARAGYRHLRLVHDPFGWRQAMSVPGRETLVGA